MSRPRRLPEPLPGDSQGQRLCELFNYRWYPIVATLPDDAQAKPQWQTLNQYPLRPRTLWALWQDANQLVGVRFDHQTRYALIDLDIISAYLSPDTIQKITQALETIGICRVLPIQSSWSGGIHLYIPLPEGMNTFDLALAIKRCLEVHGFELRPGQLEIFPNVKRWGNAAKGQYTQYNAHRLPLQPGSGSMLLNRDLDLIGDSLSQFFQQWDLAAAQQDLTLLKVAMMQARASHKGQYQPPTSSVVSSWKRDLEREIDEGWTAYGQTNHLLKTIACYGVVFQGLIGSALVDYVEQMAIATPGYTEWCRHQHEIRQRCQGWAKSAEGYYWILGTDGDREGNVHIANNIVPIRRQHNQKRSHDAQTRIREAVNTLSNQGQLLNDPGKRSDAIVAEARCSKQTLYKYQELWHPKYDSPAAIAVAEPEMCVQPDPEPISPQSTSAIVFEGKLPEVKPDKAVQATPYMKGLNVDSFSEIPLNPCPAALDEFSTDETVDAIRRAIKRLGWTPQQFHQFVSDRFRRRWSQLDDEDRLLLLYWLRVGWAGW